MKTKPRNCTESPANLVAIVRAARQAGDRELERAARRDLADKFGIELTFRPDGNRQRETEGAAQ